MSEETAPKVTPPAVEETVVVEAEKKSKKPIRQVCKSRIKKK